MTADLSPYQRPRSVDDFDKMYSQILVKRPSNSQSDDADDADTSDVTPAHTPASTPTSTAIDRLHTEPDSEYDALDDLNEFKHLGPLLTFTPAHAPPLSMAADFSEGRLETIVGTPQKELPGTKDAYVSYLVTTKVGFLPFPTTSCIALHQQQS